MPEVIIVPVIFICLTYMVVSIARSLQRSRRDSRMAEITSKLLDRMGTGQDVAMFLNSDAYRNLLAAEKATETGVSSRILNSLQAGSVMFAAGAAMFATPNWVRDQDMKEVLAVNGTVLAAVGFALALSAVWSNVLMKRWNSSPKNELAKR